MVSVVAAVVLPMSGRGPPGQIDLSAKLGIVNAPPLANTGAFITIVLLTVQMFGAEPISLKTVMVVCPDITGV